MYSRLTNLIPATVGVEGASGLVFVDTGAPVTLLNTIVFPGAGAPGPLTTVDALDVNGVPAGPVTVLPFASRSSAEPLRGGTLGANALLDQPAWFDYQHAAFGRGDTMVPDAPGTPGVAAFSLEGGAVVPGVTLQKTRVVVSVDVEGRSYPVILDTGASFVTIGADAFAAMTADGRPTASAGTLQSSTGTGIATMARTKTMALGGMEVEGVLVAHDPEFDSHLDAISREVGHPIAGSLGGTFLRNFLVYIHYPSCRLGLALYDDRSWIVDEARRLGFTFGTSGPGGYAVYSVTPGSDAEAKGVREGDVVVAVDGQELSQLSDLEVGAVGHGPVGAVRQVQFGKASALSGQTVGIRVDELLPP
jgi:hypothetical protein